VRHRFLFRQFFVDFKDFLLNTFSAEFLLEDIFLLILFGRELLSQNICGDFLVEISFNVFFG